MGINVILGFMIIIAFLIAIVLHEISHVLMARLLGDNTPAREGRQSLSLRAHLDPLGMLLCVILAFQPLVAGLGAGLIAGPVGLGWGQPIKPDPWKLKVGPNIGVFIVAWTGLLTSLGIGLLVAFLVRFMPLQWAENGFGQLLFQFVIVFASVNICLAIFNLIPLYPLDGYHILYALLPGRQAVQFAKSAPYGPLAILLIFFLLPLISQLAGGDSYLLDVPNYIMLGSLNLVSLIAGFDASIFYLIKL
jgi:Zn-dependent protease